ncbi:MAG: NAD(P)H-dependent oxidoreductase subunit E, partial [Pseudomonadota bacterium]
SGDGNFSWEEVECLGACVNGPLVQIGKDTYEDLTPASLEAIMETIETGAKPRPGPQIARQHSAPSGGHTALTSEPRGPMGAGGYAGRAQSTSGSELADEASEARATGQPRTPIETADAFVDPGKSDGELKDADGENPAQPGTRYRVRD